MKTLLIKSVVEVFHQLHCLKRIRRYVYNISTAEGKDSQRLIRAHNKHCFNYLWQTLLCHSDVSIMSLVWNEQLHDYNASFAVKKQCRNFEVVHNWAKNREAKITPQPRGRRRMPEHKNSSVLGDV